MPVHTANHPVLTVTDDNSDYRLFVYPSLDRQGGLTIHQSDGEGSSMEFTLDEEEVPYLKKYLAENWTYDPDAPKELSREGLCRAIIQEIKNRSGGPTTHINEYADNSAFEINNKSTPTFNGIVFRDPVTTNTITMSVDQIIEVKTFFDWLFKDAIDGYI